jgi:hypothetical protein
MKATDTMNIYGTVETIRLEIPTDRQEAKAES